MPAWSFHIKLATDVSNVLKLNKEEENLFILANKSFTPLQNA